MNIGGRDQKHYEEARPLAQKVAEIAEEIQEKIPGKRIFGKNGGLTGAMQAFGEAYEERRIPWVPVLTKKLDRPKYAPPIARRNKWKRIEKNNSDRLNTIIRDHRNKVLIVTSGGSGTFEEISSAICENEWRIKWPQEAHVKPFLILVIGDTAIHQWRPILQVIFRELKDTHPQVEVMIRYITVEYAEKGVLRTELFDGFGITTTSSRLRTHGHRCSR